MEMFSLLLTRQTRGRGRSYSIIVGTQYRSVQFQLKSSIKNENLIRFIFIATIIFQNRFLGVVVED